MIKEIRTRLNKYPLLNFLASIKLAVVLIFILCVLVVAGTLEQSSNGLFLAREKYFNSYICFFGPVPFPGTLTILWLLSLNLICAFLLRFNLKIKNIGLIMSHLGLILLFISGFFHFYYSQESFIEIQEAETRSSSESYEEWQLEIKEFDKNFKLLENKVHILNKKGKANQERNIILKDGTRLFIERQYTNAKVFHTPFAGTLIKEFPLEKEYEKNIPAIKFLLTDQELYLDGDQNDYEKISESDKNFRLHLKRESFELPFSIELIDVKRELHPNSSIAKTYSSKVLFKDGGVEREAIISMNKPIRSGLYTIYQARYGVDLDGNEFSVLAVVKNLNYQLPYWATLLINLGLLVHFIFAFLNYRRRLQA